MPITWVLIFSFERVAKKFVARCRDFALLVVAYFAVLPVVHAISFPPYEVYPYVADSGDALPLNYMKVCEPGRTGEAHASYVVLGVSYPRSYPAVSANYSGDLVIPAVLGGLPVRKINAAAFLACTKLRSVTIPATVREIGERAFAECYQLTNVTFASGITCIGDAAFTNCVALTSVRFPKTLARLGSGCFQGCIALTDVYFDGNAPRLLSAPGTDKSVLGESVFRTSGSRSISIGTPTAGLRRTRRVCPRSGRLSSAICRRTRRSRRKVARWTVRHLDL